MKVDRPSFLTGRKGRRPACLLRLQVHSDAAAATGPQRTALSSLSVSQTRQDGQ